MENLSTYKHYATAISTSVVKKPIIVIPAIGIIELSNIQVSLALFFVLLFFDFLTGVLASYTEWKKLEKKTKFFKDRKDGFTSEKWRLSLVKTITYLALILLVHLAEKTFQIKPFELQYTEIKLVTITLIAIAISCGIEFYSIFFENLPRAGFSIEDESMKAFNKVKSIFTKVKNFKDGQVD